MYSVVFIVSLLVVSLSGIPRIESIEEADWSLIEGQQPQDSSYEYRLYPSAQWVSSNITGVDYNKARRKVFMRLFKYISGNNAKNLSIAMTTPVTTVFRNRPCPYCNVTFTMSFYIPKVYQGQAPQPRDRKVFVTTVPNRKVFVKRFGGRPKANDWRVRASKLYMSLNKNGVSDIEKDTFLAVGYDAPDKIFRRRNEVWLMDVESAANKNVL